MKNLKRIYHWLINWGLFVLIACLSILSTFEKLECLNIGIFNYSILIIVSLVIPHFSYIKKQLINSEIQSVKLPFVELNLIKKYDFCFIGELKKWSNDEENFISTEESNLVVLGYYEGLLNEKEAEKEFKKEFPNAREYEIDRIIKQSFFKKND